MSKIIKETRWRKLSHIVEVEKKYYLVDSNNTPDHSYETMVFEWNNEKGDVVSWQELYCQRYYNEKAMIERHYYICENLKSILEENKNYESDITINDAIITLLSSLGKYQK